jgi:hypothetical protein
MLPSLSVEVASDVEVSAVRVEVTVVVEPPVEFTVTVWFVVAATVWAL